MAVVFAVLLSGVLLFGFVVLFGAPYLPTLKRQTEIALDLLDLRPGQTMLELGCGDGRMLTAAAKRDWQVIGMELNPILVLISRLRTWRYRKQVKVIWKNYWFTPFPSADGIYVFLLDRYMEKLDKKIIQDYNGKNIKLVSFAFKVPAKKISNKKNGLYLYHYN